MISKSRYPLVSLVLVSGLMVACSGDDGTGGGAGGSAAMGGSSGGGGAMTDARVDSSAGAGGADASADRNDGRADAIAEARADATGGAGGMGGDSGGADRDAAPGTGGREAGPDSGPDARPETGTGGSSIEAGPEAGPDVTNDVPVTVPDVVEASPGVDADAQSVDVSDASDAGAVDQGSDVPITSDASDVVDTGVVVPPTDADHSVCIEPIGANVLFAFDDASEANGWEFDSSTTLGLAGYPPPQDTQPPDWTNADGCPAAGMLHFSVPFNNFAGLPDDAGMAHPQGVHFLFAFNPRPDWSAFRTIHMKLMVTARAGLEFIQPFVDVSSPSGIPPIMNPDGSTVYTADNLGVGVWRDLIINLPANIVPSDIAFELYAHFPGTVDFVVDSIWIE